LHGCEPVFFKTAGSRSQGAACFRIGLLQWRCAGDVLGEESEVAGSQPPKPRKRGRLYVNDRYARPHLECLSRSRYRFAILCSLYYSFFLCSVRLVVHTSSIPHPSKHPSFNPSTIYPTPTRPHSNVPRHQTPYSASRYFRELAGLRVTPDETDIPLRP
jgi:hypothetical protein